MDQKKIMPISFAVYDNLAYQIGSIINDIQIALSLGKKQSKFRYALNTFEQIKLIESGFVLWQDDINKNVFTILWF